MTIRAGDRLGPYEILSAIGAGGMGEVFRARDSRLHRIVAIKVLPGDKMSEPDRKRRFLQEARAASALNHPNIVTLHDIANDGGVDYLVMEYVPGKSLDKLIPRNGFPMETALNYAAQIASALAGAHAAGIVHRDVKPANVIVTPDSQVKILDFGIAKLIEPTHVSSEAETRDSALTKTGMVIGTVAYMSPEQVSGNDLDHRTDIFSLGIVLYEMLSGRRPFVGNTHADTMHAIAHDPHPRLTGIPPRVEELIEKTLAKDPSERYQHAGDLAIDLRGLGRVPSAQRPAVPRPRRRSMMWLLALVGISGLVGAILWLWPRPTTSTREPIQFTFEPPENATLPRDAQDTAVSPEGRRVAFSALLASGTRAIWVRSLDTQEASRIVGTDGATNPFWSPDGEFIGFFADGKLKKIALAGGPPQNICNTTPGQGATWSTAGEIVFNPTNRAPLMRVSASGGTPQQLTTLDAALQENSHRWPSFLPDGRHFLFTARSSLKENTAIYVGSLDSKERKRLLTEQSNAVYSRPGYLLFGREGTLMAQRFDPGKLELSGNPFPVAGNIDQETPSANAFFSVSADGSVLAYHEAGRALSELTWFDRKGSIQGLVGPKGRYGQPRLSPDGKRLAVYIPDPVSGNRDLWIINLENASRTRFTSNPANDWFPVWSPDGAYLAFASDRTSPPSILRKALTGDREEELLWTGPANVTDWSSDGKYLLLNGVFGGPSSDLLLLALNGDQKPSPIFLTAFTENYGAFSPDGKWIAYESNESGMPEVYIRSMQRPERQRVSANGGTHPRWRRDGKEIFYVTSDNKMMAADVLLGEPLTVSAPQMLFAVCNSPRTDSYSPDYEVTPDGKRFISACQSNEVKKRSITVAVQWTSLLKYPGSSTR